MNVSQNQAIDRIRRGDVVKVIWKDAVEGPVDQSFIEQVLLREPITATISTTGRYLRTFDSSLILEDVIYEESRGAQVYKKQGAGKWLSIPIGVIEQVIPVAEIDSITDEIKRRRTVFKQLTFIPRLRRLPTGEFSRVLYLA